MFTHSLLTHAILIYRYDRDPQYDFLRPCLLELGDDDGNDDVSWTIHAFLLAFRFLASPVDLFSCLTQDVCQDVVPDAISEDDSWHSENDDSDADKPPVVVAKRSSKVSAGKKATANKMQPASTNPSASILQNRVPAAVVNVVPTQDGSLSAPASLHMPAIPFEAVDDAFFDGVDEDYGAD